MSIRGVPGTHDIQKIFDILKKFDRFQYPIEIPIFDKLNDKLLHNKRTIKKKCDILILEGWCCGAKPVEKKYLYKNINTLEKKFDNNFIWRNFYNNQLKQDYYKLFNKFDALIYFKAPSFSHVLKWRLKQENNMKKKLVEKKKRNE